MAKRKKKFDSEQVLSMTVNGSPMPFTRVQFCQNLNVEYDRFLDIYKGEIKVWPSPIVHPHIEFHEDGTLKLPYGTEVDFTFGPDATIRGKVLNLRGKLRIIEVGMKVGDILHEITPDTREKPDVNAEALESFAEGLEIVEGVV